MSMHSLAVSEYKLQVFYKNTPSIIPSLTVIGAIGGARPKSKNGEGCIRKGIRHKIIASALVF
jgi:hypothetical protein